MTATTARACHQCGGIMRPLVNCRTKIKSYAEGCEHCDRPHESGTCRTCTRIFKTARMVWRDDGEATGPV